VTAASSPHQPLCQLTTPYNKRKVVVRSLSSSKRIDGDPASKLPSARGFLLGPDGMARRSQALVLAPFPSPRYRLRMARDGALTLSDLRSPTLSIVCEPCARRGRYAVARLLEEHGDAKLTELLVTLANCPKARSASVYDRCKAVYEGLVVR
jgi:hypothetical protein